jgi:GNAT superfamily N-acetyltransferase
MFETINKTETPLEIIESIFAQIAEMNADLGVNGFEIDVKQHIVGLISGDIFAVVYRVDGQIAGHQVWFIYKPFNHINKKRATLQYIYIKKEFQKRGLFKEFLNFGIAEVKKLNLDSVTIATTVGNKLYQICEAYEYKQIFVEYEA